MKPTKFVFMILLLWLLLQAALAEENRFVSFINNPTSAEYNAIVADLKVQTTEYKEWNSFQRYYKEWARFLRLVESSDTLAVDLADKLAPKTGGGNLEDLCRAIGMNVRPYPGLVLWVLKENQASEYQLSCRLTMLPMNTVDKIDAQLAELEARVAAISTVKNPELTRYKEMALTILQENIYSLRGVRGDAPFLKRSPRRAQ